MKCLGWIERLLLILGLVLIAIYAAAYVHRTILSRAELKRFRDLQAEQPVETADHFPPVTQFKLDVSLWSQKRIAGYEQSLTGYVDPPLAVLRISKVHLEAPVLDGTDDVTLNRGVGHIVGTDRPGEDGNIGIAGHRDGFFRALKDVTPGNAKARSDLRRRSNCPRPPRRCFGAATAVASVPHPGHMLPILFCGQCATTLHRSSLGREVGVADSSG